MIKEIKEIYGEFSDSWISKVEIKKNSISIIIICSNRIKNFKYEKINILCNDIISYKIDEVIFSDHYAVKDALIEKIDNYILIDFDPIDYYNYLKENENSIFKIKCKQIDYEFIDFYEE